MKKWKMHGDVGVDGQHVPNLVIQERLTDEENASVAVVKDSKKK